MNTESKQSEKEFDGLNIFDFPPSALDVYRKKASFDWKQMKLLFVGRDMIEFQVCCNLLKLSFTKELLIPINCCTMCVL